MFNELNANAPPFSPKPMYPDTFPGTRSVSLSQNTTPELSISESASACTLESDHIRNLWVDRKFAEPQSPSKPCLPTPGHPLYQASGAVSAWLNSSDSEHPRFVQDEVQESKSAKFRAQDVHADTFIDGYCAEPYIPMVLRKRARADPVGCSLGRDVPWYETQPWIHPLRKGCAQKRHSDRQQSANDVVNRGPWNARNISRLAGMLTEHAMEESGPVPSNNALFARQVYERFQAVGPLPASLFQNQLVQAVFAEFKAYWMPNVTSSIPNIPICSPHPPHAHPMHHLSCALAIASYLGDLFSLGLLNGSVVDLCLRQVVGSMRLLEQLQAAHAIISHCDSKLAVMVSIRDIFVRLELNAANIAPNTSVVGALFNDDYTRLYVHDIRETFQQWEAQPPTQEMLVNPIYPIVSQSPRLTRISIPYAPHEQFSSTGRPSSAGW